MLMTRRRLLALGALTLTSGTLLAACGDDEMAGTSEPTATGARPGGWYMPAEEYEHAATWMCWPSSGSVWGRDLPDVQDAILGIALAIAEFEPVSMLARPGQIGALKGRLGSDVELIDAPVDDLWARDTLPCFLIRDGAAGNDALAAGHVRFNGWGGKQIHSGDARLASLVAQLLGAPVVESGLVGEGGGLEVDGAGTVLVAASSWVNDNRNPGRSREQIEAALLKLLGAERMMWIDGLAGADITDGHVDTLARFIDPGTIVVDSPALADPDDPWVEVATQTRRLITEATTSEGKPYEVVTVTQPASPRGTGDDFLATYMNYYVCNGAVIAPQFGDRAADSAARGVLEERFPGREVVMLDIDAVAAGGGGIHCATQQQPKT